MVKWVVLGLVLLLGACAANQLPQTVALATVEGEATAVGSFVGASNHETRGEARVLRLADGSYAVELGPDFFHDGAPDPVVGFGADGYVAASKLGPLQALTGRQVYAVPVSVDVGDFNEVYVWCERFAVPLGVARLELG